MTFFSADVYPGDGSQQTFGLTFDYIDRNSVYVYLIDNTTGAQTELTVITSGVPATGQYIWDSDTQVRLGDVPTTGQSVKIQRRTDISQQAVQWTGGSYITSDDLNTSEEQNLYVDQELSDWLKEITGGGSGPGDFVDLDNLGDVTITNPAEPEVLRYDGTTAKWVNTPNRDIADQDAGTPTWDDTAQATAGAIARRHDNIISPTLPPAAPYQEGKFWFQDDVNKTLSIWNGTGWISITSGGTFTTQPKVIYVDSVNGDDAFDGHRIISPKRTIKAAVEQANGDTSYGDGSIIIVVPGVYQETLPITITAQNLSIVGQSIRSVFVHPTTATEEEVMFLCDSGTYINGFTFAGLKASGTRGDAGSVDPDATYGLPPNQGWVAAFRTGSIIKKSPYVQNCTNFCDSQIDNDNFDPNNFPGQGGDLTSAPTGGGILVDGAAPDSTSVLRSFVVDAFTQICLDGPGVLCTNNGYAQLVSFFGTFCHYHAKALNGGQLNLSNCTTDFGRYGLIADGRSTSALFTGTTTGGPYIGYVDNGDGTYVNGAVDITVTGLTTGWSTNQPGDTMIMQIGSDFYPILSSSVVSGNQATVTVLNPQPNQRNNNLGLNPGTVTDGTAVSFYLQSYISTGGHTFEFVGSGTDYRAHPNNGGRPDPTKKTTELGGTGVNAGFNGGRIWQSSTDEDGRFAVGDTLVVDQKTGYINIDPSAVASNVQSDLTPTLGGDLDVNGYKILGDRAGGVGDVVLEVNAASTIQLLGGDVTFGSTGAAKLPAGTEVQRPGTPAAGMIRFNTDADKFEGYDGASWGSLIGGDIGTDPENVPLNQFLGKQAFVDEVGTIRPNASAPQQNLDIIFEYVSDTSINVKMRGADGVVRSSTLTLS